MKLKKHNLIISRLKYPDIDEISSRVTETHPRNVHYVQPPVCVCGYKMNKLMQISNRILRLSHMNMGNMISNMIINYIDSNSVAELEEKQIIEVLLHLSGHQMRQDCYSKLKRKHKHTWIFITTK